MAEEAVADPLKEVIVKNINWQQVISNMLAAAAIGYGAGGWKMAVASALSNLAALFQTAPHQQNGKLDEAIRVMKESGKL